MTKLVDPVSNLLLLLWRGIESENLRESAIVLFQMAAEVLVEVGLFILKYVIAGTVMIDPGVSTWII